MSKNDKAELSLEELESVSGGVITAAGEEKLRWGIGLAKKLAQKMDAGYFRVDKLSEDSLLRVWRRMSN